MADATDSAPPPNVPSRVASLRPNNSSPHMLLSQQDSYTGKSSSKGKKESKKGESWCIKHYCFTFYNFPAKAYKPDISNPVDFEHMIHVGFDPVTGEFTVRNLYSTVDAIGWGSGLLLIVGRHDPMNW